MAREDTDVRDDDNIDQMNDCWIEQNMTGENNDVGVHDDVDELDKIL
jgi:hypothetical protein